MSPVLMQSRTFHGAAAWQRRSTGNHETGETARPLAFPNKRTSSWPCEQPTHGDALTHPSGGTMNHGSTLSAAQKLWSSHARRFLAEYPTRERFLAASHGADKSAAEAAVRELGILFDVDLIGALVAIRSNAPPANAFESDLLHKYDAVQAHPK